MENIIVVDEPEELKHEKTLEEKQADEILATKKRILGGAQKVYQSIPKTKRDELKITQKLVQEVMRSNNKIAPIIKKQEIFHTIEAPYPNAIVQIDLMYIQKTIVLNTIDIFSRFMEAKVLKSKTAKDVIGGLESIFRARKPVHITSDRGTEFLNKDFKKYAADQKINWHYSNIGDHNHMGVIERANRTLREMLFEYNEWDDDENKPTKEKVEKSLQEVLKKYNYRIHSSIDTTPKKLLDLETVATKKAAEKKKELRVESDDSIPIALGQKVRIIIQKKTFGKSTDKKLSDYKEVTKIAGYKYYLDNDDSEYYKRRDLYI